MSGKRDRKFMQEAIDVARESRRLGDYAIAAIVVRDGKVIARAGNRIRTENDPTSHSEVVALRMACREVGGRYLQDCTLYTTHAPCLMCLTACVWAKVGRVVYGASQGDIIAYGEKHGNDKYKWRGLKIEPEDAYVLYMEGAHPNMQIGQCMQPECKALFHNKP